jgi:hypothetical protein
MTRKIFDCALGRELTDEEADEMFPIVPVPLADQKAIKWTETKGRRDMAIDAGVTVAGIGTFDSDATSRANINGAVTMALIAQSAGAPFSITWKLADNTIAMMNAAQMIAVGVAVGQHVALCHANAQSLGVAITGASDEAALSAVNVNAGWPA